jgi:hypothetical protein
MPRSPRHAPKLREAIRLHVIEGLSPADAAKAAGMTADGFLKALGRDSVKALAAAMRAGFVQKIENALPLHRARALAAAAELVQKARNESVRLRACELILGGRPVPPPDEPVEPPEPQFTYEYVRQAKAPESEEEGAAPSPAA